MTQCTQCNAQMQDSAVTCPSCGASVAPASTEGSNPLYWFKKVIFNYVGFSGRARRKEFWMFYLVNTIINVGLNIIGGILHTGSLLGSIYGIAVLLPTLAVAIRRMHDIDRSGWWILVPFFNIYLFCLDGTQGANRFGNNVKPITKR